MDNIFDEFTTKITDSPKSELLDRINIVDPNSGALLAQYDRTAKTWKRVH